MTSKSKQRLRHGIASTFLFFSFCVTFGRALDIKMKKKNHSNYYACHKHNFNTHIHIKKHHKLWQHSTGFSLWSIFRLGGHDELYSAINIRHISQQGGSREKIYTKHLRGKIFPSQSCVHRFLQWKEIQRRGFPSPFAPSLSVAFTKCNKHKITYITTLKVNGCVFRHYKTQGI